MTAILTVTCDRCHEVIPADRTALKAESGPGRHRLPDGIDLRPACLDQLLAWLAQDDAGRAAGDQTEEGVDPAGDGSNGILEAL
jgi:hypothetical protein